MPAFLTVPGARAASGEISLATLRAGEGWKNVSQEDQVLSKRRWGGAPKRRSRHDFRTRLRAAMMTSTLSATNSAMSLGRRAGSSPADRNSNRCSPPLHVASLPQALSQLCSEGLGISYPQQKCADVTNLGLLGAGGKGASHASTSWRVE